MIELVGKVKGNFKRTVAREASVAQNGHICDMRKHNVVAEC